MKSFWLEGEWFSRQWRFFIWFWGIFFKFLISSLIFIFSKKRYLYLITRIYKSSRWGTKRRAMGENALFSLLLKHWVFKVFSISKLVFLSEYFCFWVCFSFWLKFKMIFRIRFSFKVLESMKLIWSGIWRVSLRFVCEGACFYDAVCEDNEGVIFYKFSDACVLINKHTHEVDFHAKQLGVSLY